MTPLPAGDDDLMTLDQAATLVPGADADTLKRRIRQGKLGATRPGKPYLTTRADVRKMIELCRVTPKVRDSGFVPPVPKTIDPPLGSSLMELGNAALDSALAQARGKKKTR